MEMETAWLICKEGNKMLENMKVMILMSFYNGDQYIVEQIQSILQQDFPGKIEILIRNDGSTKTNIEDILQKIEVPYNREIILKEEKNLGPQKSFLKLIQMADSANYYFYADQDDVWELNKVSRAVTKMEEMDSAVKLYCSDYRITDSNLNVIYEKGVHLDDKTFHFLRAIMFNTFPGCVMGMNQQLLDLLKKMNLENCMMHDSYTYATALAAGQVYYDSKPSILHRIHQSNVVGYGSKKIEPCKWLKEKMTLLVKKEEYDLALYAEKLLEVSDGQNLNFQKDILILKNYKKSFRNTWKLLMHSDLRHKVDRCSLSIWCKVLFRLF